MKRNGLALGLLIGTVWVGALLVQCHANLRTITVNGSFGQKSANDYFGLALPIPFQFFVQYDDQASNTGTPSIAVYETEGAYWGLSFGTGLQFHFFTGSNTEVRVYHNAPGLPEAIGFGNEDGFTQYGLVVDPYRVYALFPNLLWPGTPGYDSSLSQVQLRKNDFHFQVLSYVFIFGHVAPWTETWLQTTTTQQYSVSP